MGRSRALEVLLGCEDFDADLAERYGYVNRALDADEIGPFVERLAYRIASFPAKPWPSRRRRCWRRNRTSWKACKRNSAITIRTSRCRNLTVAGNFTSN